MYFDYESAYDGRELVTQIRQEKEVAKEIGLTERSTFLGLMQNLVCSFFEIRRIDSAPQMSSEVIKMKMSNEAHEIINYLTDPLGQKTEKNGEAVRRKVYKYPCHICKKEYNNMANHLRHAHKLSKNEMEELKKEKNQERIRGNQEMEKKGIKKRPVKSCPLEGCTWVGRRYDYHLPKVHAIKKGSKKYLSLINKRNSN